MLYKRDYLLGLTDEEKKEFKEVTGSDFSVKRIGGFGTELLKLNLVKLLFSIPNSPGSVHK